MKYSVLGFLIDQPMHGYALKRALSPALPPQQQVNDGILYPLLKRLEADGLVRKRVERGRGSRDRHVFHPTAKGRRAFEQWLAGTDDEGDEVTYDFLLGHPFLTKCLFFSRLTPAEIAREVRRTARRLHREARDVQGDPRAHGRPGGGPHRVAVLDLGIAQQKEKERWLKRMIRESQRADREGAA